MANYDCLSYFLDQKYKFHLLTPGEFEDLAAIVLEDIYNRKFLVYKAGPDEGVDAEGSNIGMLQSEKIIAQVKHTSNELETLTGDKRRDRFEKPEKPKVEKLVRAKRLEKYVIFTNYQLPADQAQRLKECFKKAEAKEVEVVGYETLCLRLIRSFVLETTLLNRYPNINPKPSMNTTINNQCMFVTLSEDRPSPSRRSESEPDIKGIRF